MIGHVNVYHLDNKTHEVSALLQHHGLVQILGITETRLSPHKHSADCVSISNYTFFRRDAHYIGHTGIGAYVHHSLSNFTKRRLDLELSSIECLWLEIRSTLSPPFLVGFIYRNPASHNNWFDDFEQMMDRVNSCNLNTFILGDFNIDLLIPQPQWSNFINMFGLTQMIKNPTRITNTSSTLLDHIYTNNINAVSKSFVSNICMSDHRPIICELSFKTPKSNLKGHTYYTYRNFKHFSYDAYLRDLSFINFNQIMSCINPDEAADLFMKLLLSVVDLHAPLKKKRVKHSTLPNWMTQELRDAMRLRDSLKKSKKWDEYKKQRNKISELVKKAKKLYFKKLVSNKDSNISSLWRAVNEFTNKSRKPSPCTQNVPFTADDMNNHFLSLTDSIINSKLNSVNDTYTIPDYLNEFCRAKLNHSESFVIPRLTVSEVWTLVMGLNNKRTMDIYNINSYIIKLSLPYIIVALTYLYNLCIDHNIFPESFKLAKVVPLPKTKNGNNLDNLRPISVLPILSKPIERHIHIHLTKYLESNSLLHPYQSGFRNKHSCQTALTRLVDTWLHAINNQNIVGAVFLDLRKAFDLVCHEILLQKLKVYLQNNESCAFFFSYLSNRQQAVYANGAYSSFGQVKCGVPQGSILGPVFFCLYINDLPLSLSLSEAILEMFADDSTLHTKSDNIKCIESTLQRSIEEVNTWCDNNRMALHPTKSKSMVLSTRQKHQRSPLRLNLKLLSTNIEQVHELKLLGIRIDDEFSWKSHTDFISKKLSMNLFLLHKLKQLVPPFALKPFFHAHCMSHINYASNLWCNAPEVYIKKINSLYRRALKILNTKPVNTPNAIYINLNILPLKDQFLYNTAILMFKIFHEKTPDYLMKFFQKPFADNRLQTCKFPLPRIDLFKTSLSFWGATVWNSLPQSCKLSTTLRLFKLNIYKHLFQLLS